MSTRYCWLCHRLHGSEGCGISSTVVYCWLCDKPGVCAADTHYETGRVIYFCSLAHWGSYRELAEL